MQIDPLNRREFITLVGGSAAAGVDGVRAAAASWPLGAWAQQPGPQRRIEFVSNSAPTRR
jgi:hypothetical protein